MSDTPTPETDAAVAAHRANPNGPVVSTDFARKLERERDEYKAKYVEAKAERDALQAAVDAFCLHRKNYLASHCDDDRIQNAYVYAIEALFKLASRQVLNRIEKLYQAGEEDWTIMDAIKQLRREC